MPAKPSQNLKPDLRVGLVGQRGRMGRHIGEILAETSRFGQVVPINSVGAWSNLPDIPDVVIDFSNPEGLAAALDWCVRNQVPIVSGTTGIGPDVDSALREASKTIPVLYSANMSPGIAVLSAMLEHFGRLADWDFHVDEIHHNQKKDSPSGTALLLDQRLGEVLGRKCPRPNSIRGGSVPGIHQVWAMGPDEMVMLQHTAFDRRVFARGAVRAAGWLFDKGQPGFYELKDLYKK